MENKLCSGEQQGHFCSIFCSPDLAYSHLLTQKWVQMAVLSAFTFHRLQGLEGPQELGWYRDDPPAA